MFRASIKITLRPSILDPQGKATRNALNQLGFEAIEKVRMGKSIELWIDAATANDAESMACAACEKLLANPVIEDFEITLENEATTVA